MTTLMTGDNFFGKGLTDRYNSSQSLSSPAYLVLYHELGGHGYYKYLAQDPQQRGRAVDYENKVRALNDLGTRPYDDIHKDPNNP